MSWLVRVTTIAVLCVGLSDVAAAQPRYTVAGVVTDTGGKALADAQVLVFVSGREISRAITAANGHFTLTTRTDSAATLHVRRLGFEPWNFYLRFPRDTSRSFAVALKPAVLVLQEVPVVDRAPEVAGWLNEFETRRRKNSFGHFYTRDALTSAIARQPSEVLRMIPSVQLIAVQRGGYTVRIRGCRYAPIVWVDGMRAPKSELDEVVNLQDIAGMEVYTSNAGVPAQFLDRSNAGCGTILVWTRHQ